MKRAICAAFVVALVLAPMQPAAASHTVEWGPGNSCDDASTKKNRKVRGQVGDSINFIMCVSIFGDPFSGHQAEIRVSPGGRARPSQTQANQQGVARFKVIVTRARNITVTVCDPDGCVYGTATIRVSEAASPTPTAAPSVPSPSAATASVSPTAPSRSATPAPDGVAIADDDDLLWWIILITGLVILIIGIWIRNQQDDTGYVATPDGVYFPSSGEDVYVPPPYDTTGIGPGPVSVTETTDYVATPDGLDLPPPIQKWEIPEDKEEETTTTEEVIWYRGQRYTGRHTLPPEVRDRYEPGGAAEQGEEQEEKEDCSKLRARCEERRREAKAAQEAAREARALADAAEKASDEASDRKDDAEEALDEAKEELERAESDQPDEGSWAESEGRRITTHDINLEKDASADAWARYKSGEITAEELESEWNQLQGDPEKLKELRERDEQAREASRAEARRNVDDAQKKYDDATAADEAASKAAEEAGERADEAKAKAQEAQAAADRACKAAEDCEKRGGVPLAPPG